MLRSYLKIAWRNMLRNKTNSIINILGLSIGILCVIFIALYVQDELSYDKGFKNAGHIYQVNLDGNFGGQQFNTSNTPPPLGIALHDAFPEVSDYTRIRRMSREVVHPAAAEPAANSFSENGLWAVDSNFLQVFDYAMLEGDPKTCLQPYHAVVLTASAAKKYFGNESAIGKALLFDEYKDPFVVTAVLKDLPSNASLQFGLLIPVRDCPLVQRFSWSWVWCTMSTYVVLRDQTAGDAAAIRQLQAKFPSMVRQQAVNAFNRIGQPYDEFIRKGGKWNFYLQALTDIHLHSAGIGTQLSNAGDIKYVYIFSLIALFIIGLACVNFMNLSTAQALRRAKEIGVRKVLGSLKGQLIRQFLAEALLYSVLATILAILLLSPLMEPFNRISGKYLHFSDLWGHGIWMFVLVLSFLTGILAGSYPAFYLTSFQPIEALKGGGLFVRSAGSQFIRNGLVIFQFTVSVALIICTIVVFRQLRYMQDKDMGLTKENVVIIPNIEKLGKSAEAFRQEIAQIPGVESAGISTGVPANEGSEFTDFYVPESNGVAEPVAKDITLTSFVVDEDVVPALHLQVISGRNFSKAFNDSASVIINEKTAMQIGWKDPLGKLIRYPGGNDVLFKVIGVVKDFNLESLHNEVMPFALFYTTSKTNNNGAYYIIARTRPGNPDRILRAVAGAWKSFNAATPFDYSFLDKDYEALYRSEQRLGNVFTVFTLLSIVVACLGLFGLSVYTAERRVKEIGIRKILGASVQSLVTLLSREFLKLVVLSTVIAFPLAWWAMTTWLNDFAYRAPFNAWVFIGAGSLAVVIALLTVSFQAIKAALTNPAKSLRSE